MVKLAEEQLGLPPTTEKVLVLNDADPSKGIPAATKVLEDEGLPVSDENIFIAATCKEKGIRFLQGKAEVGVRKIDPNAASEAPVASPTESGKPAEYVVSVGRQERLHGFRRKHGHRGGSCLPSGNQASGRGKLDLFRSGLLGRCC